MLSHLHVVINCYHITFTDQVYFLTQSMKHQSNKNKSLKKNKTSEFPLINNEPHSAVIQETSGQLQQG